MVNQCIQEGNKLTCDDKLVGVWRRNATVRDRVDSDALIDTLVDRPHVAHVQITGRLDYHSS